MEHMKKSWVFGIVGVIVAGVVAGGVASVDAQSLQRIPAQQAVPVEERPLTPPPQRLPRQPGDTTAVSPVQQRNDIQDIQQNRQEIRNQVDQQRNERRDQVDAARDDLRQQRDELQDKGCERVELEIETRMARYDNNQGRNDRRFELLQTRLTKAAAAFAEQGYDTTALESATAELLTKIVQNRAEYATFITMLESAQEYACGESEGQFRQAMEDARMQLREVRQATAEIRNQYQTEVRSALVDLREQLAGDLDPSLSPGSARPPAQGQQAPQSPNRRGNSVGIQFETGSDPQDVVQQGQ